MIIVTAVPKEGGDYQLGIQVQALGSCNADSYAPETTWIKYYSEQAHKSVRVRESLEQIQKLVKAAKQIK